MLNLFNTEVEQDTTIPIKVTEDLMVRITKLADELAKKDGCIAKLEERLVKQKKERNLLATKTLPELMDETGQSMFELAESGVRIQVDDKIQASIKEEDRKSAYEWLERNKHEDIIKGEVKVTFNRKEHKMMLAFEKLLAGGKLSKVDIQAIFELLTEFTGKVVAKESIHHSTLTSFVREILKKDNGTFPRDLFSVFEYREAKFVKGKNK